MPEAALAKTEFVGLTLWRTRSGEWQASLQSEEGGGWRVCIEPTPIAALRAVLRLPTLEIPAIVPPPPC